MSASTSAASSSAARIEQPSVPIYRWALAGVVATIVMVILGGISRALGLITGVGALLMAKWFNLVVHGHPFVTDIRTASGEPLPAPLATLVHLSIGAAFAVIYGLGARRFARSNPPWWAAVVFGIATCIANGFLTFPGMGFGPFGVDGPPEMMMVRTNLVMHLYYGLGLALAAQFLCSPARRSTAK